MAYGGSEFGVAATTIDKWLNTGSNGLDLYSSHNVVLAVLLDKSFEPGGGYMFRKGSPGEGMQVVETVYGRVGWTFQGVDRTTQLTGIADAINDDATRAKYNWAHYEGKINDNYEDKVKNSGKAQMVNLKDLYLGQIRAKAFNVVGTHMMNDVIDSITKVGAFNYFVSNTGTVGAIDQTDAVNNGWWQAVVNSDSVSFTSNDLDFYRAEAMHDTGLPTGVTQNSPDICFLYGSLWAKLLGELKQSQRVKVEKMIRGGAEYIDYAGMRCFRETRGTAGTVVGFNSSTLFYRYNTKMPEPVTPDFVPVSGKPSMWERGFNWVMATGCLSPKHNFRLNNRS